MHNEDGAAGRGGEAEMRRGEGWGGSERVGGGMGWERGQR